MSIESAASAAARKVLLEAKRQGRFRGATEQELGDIAEAVGAGLGAVREELTRTGIEALGRILPRRRV
jgi:hypothetical protein